MEREEHEGLLGWLDGPRLVVGAFAFFLLGLTVLGILIWTDVREQQRSLVVQVERIDELALANRKRTRAANEEAVVRCFASASQGPALLEVLRVIEDDVSSEEAKQAVRDFRELTELNAQTVADCRKLAKTLKVPIPKGVR